MACPLFYIGFGPGTLCLSRQEWESRTPNPSQLALWNRICALESAIAPYHESGDDAPLQFYDELEERNAQYQASIKGTT